MTDLEKAKEIVYNSMEGNLDEELYNNIEKYENNHYEGELNNYYRKILGMKAGIIFINYEYRNELAEYLESKKIQTRNLFAGNLLKHPAFDEMRKSGEGYRVVGELKGTDFVMTNTLWIGVYPGMTEEMLQHMIATIKEFVASK